MALATNVDDFQDLYLEKLFFEPEYPCQYEVMPPTKEKGKESIVHRGFY